MIIDHLYLSVTDYERARDFYRAALAPLGISLVMEVGPEQAGRAERAAAFGRDGKPELFLATRGDPARNVHVALVAPDRAAVRAFHDAAVAAGGADNGAPGLRPHYHEHYYGGFVLDPDGYNVEAVCHRPE
jgi:catechol 2,3-dioxygenase-like lactoylglutathione lyase family enzyme